MVQLEGTMWTSYPCQSFSLNFMRAAVFACCLALCAASEPTINAAKGQLADLIYPQLKEAHCVEGASDRIYHQIATETAELYLNALKEIPADTTILTNKDLQEALVLVSYKLFAQEANTERYDVIVPVDILKAYALPEMLLEKSRFDNKRHVLPITQFCLGKMGLYANLMKHILARSPSVFWNDAYVVTELMIFDKPSSQILFTSFFEDWRNVPNAAIVRPETLQIAKDKGLRKIQKRLEAYLQQQQKNQQ